MDADLVRDGLNLKLVYILGGSPARLRLPHPTVPKRADGLWQHTCFEAFISVVGSPAYTELNFSPSGEWAAYRFTRYRDGMSNVDVAALLIACRQDRARLELSATIALKDLPSGPLRIGLSAVIEDVDGNKSYWALAHPAAKPDFHDPASFILEL